MNYSVVVPTLNEVDNIDPLIGRLLALPGFTGAAELIVVDDGSTDGTVERVRRWFERGPVRLVLRRGTPDLARAVSAGVAAAVHSTIVVMDADLSHPPERVPDLLAPLAAGTHDIVVGSRHVPGGATIGWPLHRRLLSRLAGLLAWPICDLSDPTSGFCAARRVFFEKIGPDAAGYKVVLELVAAAEGNARIAEIPIAFRDRVAGRSKLSLRAQLLYLVRLGALAGGRLSATGARRSAAGVVIGAILDFALLWLLLQAGAGLAAAQLAGFLAATTVGLLVEAGPSLAGSSPPSAAAGRALRFLVVAMLALALRCAVLAWAAPGFGLPIAFLVPVAIIATGIVDGVGAILFVADGGAAIGGEVRWRVMILGLVAYLVDLRGIYFGMPQLSGNEAYYWAYAQHPSLSYLDHPPLVAWLIWLGTALAGHTELGVRLAAPLCWLVATFFISCLTRDLFGKSAAIRAALLMAITPYFYAIGLSMTPDTPLVACWAGAMFFLSRLLVFGDRRAWLGLGLAFGLGLLSKYSIALLALPAAFFLLADPQARRWLRRPEPYWAVALAAVLFLPVLVWNAENGWASFLFQSTRRLENESTPAGILGSWVFLALALATPIAILAIALSFFRPATSASGDPADGVALRGRRFLRISLLVPLGILLVLSLRSPVKPYWMGPALLAGVPLAADIMWVPVLRAWRSARLLDRAWAPTALILALIFGFALPYSKIGLPFVPPPAGQIDWRRIAAAAEQLERRVKADTGAAPLTVVMDTHALASELGFYDPDGIFDDITNQQLFGRKGLMYAHWLRASEAADRPLIVIGARPADLAGEGLEIFLAMPEPIRELDIGARQSSQRLYYRIARHFVASAIAEGPVRRPPS